MQRLFSLWSAAAAVLAVVSAAPAAAAQTQITFSEIPYGTRADTVQALLEGRGFRHVRTYSSGDMRFRAADDVVATALMEGDRLKGMLVWMPAAEPAARAAALLDSLRRVLGPPAGASGDGHAWYGAYSLLTLQTGAERPGGPPGVLLVYAGPRLLEQNGRRANAAADSALPPLVPKWALLGYNGDGARLALDTTSIAPRPGGGYRARIRIDHPAVVPDPSGRYDALIYGADYDCVRRRVQLRSRVALLRGRTVRTDQGATVWVTPIPGTQEALSLTLLCEYVAARPAPAGGG